MPWLLGADSTAKGETAMANVTRSIAALALATGIGLCAPPVSAQGCNTAPSGGADFQNPPEVRPTTPGARHTLEVRYTDPSTATLIAAPTNRLTRPRPASPAAT